MSYGGKNSERTLLQDTECPNCKKKGFVYFLGSAVMHGNPYSPAADTEVDHYYECASCQHEWTVYT